MVKPTLLFVDHAFHKKTHSTDFIVELLQDAFEVTSLYIEPDAPVDPAMAETEHEYVFICQMDFLTPLFLAAGKKVTVSQMYDGSGGLPVEHFLLNRQAQYVNFCVALHSMTLKAGSRSFLTQYALDPEDFEPVDNFDELRGFFWQRLPDSQVSVPRVLSLIDGQLDRLHLHVPSDNNTVFDKSLISKAKMKVTLSDWFEDPKDFQNLLLQSNVFFAPRPAEGIGMAFLEAMARGMLVIANDLPTHNEYIHSLQNGILFKNTSEHIDLRSIRKEIPRIGHNARLTLQRKREDWLADREPICAFVKSGAASVVPHGLPGHRDVILEIINAYQRGLGPYIEALQSKAEFVSAFGTWDKVVKFSKPQRSREATHESAYDDRSVIVFGYGNGRYMLETGWSDIEPGHVWAIQRSAKISCPTARLFDAKKVPHSCITAIELEMRGLASYDVSVKFAGKRLGKVALKSNFEATRLTLPKSMDLADLTEFELGFELGHQIKVPKVEARDLAFAIKSLTLHFG